MAQSASPYIVLARKYRPQSFGALIGQDAMVQTLANAFAHDRIHHAFILTGVRGVGKTTTARILARAFNYEDASGRRPTLDPPGEGFHDRAIIEGRHVDVVEMDAASNTSINDIREIIDSIKYAPSAAPYKVYIIDEVHMLSTAAFNGLLKTLEEPPPYVKFIFATTEIRKVPVTILSRCQRFDLRRIAPEVMTEYLATVLAREGVGFAPEALAMIVRAGEGSVRDCLSLLDQAIAHGQGTLASETVKAMLGLGDRARTIDLFEHVMAGRLGEALPLLRELYDGGADPETVIADLAEFTNLVSRVKVVPAAASDASLTPDEQRRGTELAGKLGMRVLTRAWQILLRGHEEVARAANPVQAAEMVLIRLGYAADLPTPDEIIARLASQPQSAPAGAPRLPPAGGPAGAAQQVRRALPDMGPVSRPETAQVARPEGAAAALPQPRSFADLVALAGEKRDILVKNALETQLRPLSFGDGRLEVALVPGSDPGIVQTLGARLKAWTGRSWMITVATAAPEGLTLKQQAELRRQAAEEQAHQDPLVQAVLETFPGARIVNVKLREDEARPTPEPGTPFEEDEE